MTQTLTHQGLSDTTGAVPPEGAPDPLVSGGPTRGRERPQGAGVLPKQSRSLVDVKGERRIDWGSAGILRRDSGPQGQPVIGGGVLRATQILRTHSDDHSGFDKVRYDDHYER